MKTTETKLYAEDTVIGEMKTIKIIDLLNKIANGEEVPKKIKYGTDIYILIDNYCYYCDETNLNLSDRLYAEQSRLNDEVEILDEPKEIKYGLKPYKEYLNDLGISYEVNNANIEYLDRTSKIIIELIDELNKLKEK